MEYEEDTHNLHLLLYHIIFCPKRRRKFLVGPLQERLHQIIREVAGENNWKVLELTIQPDYVHLFVRSNPRTLPADIARLVKGRSSHLLREGYPSLKKMPSFVLDQKYILLNSK
ncbi:MAG TPA: IS200/IS605 family transposase [Ktedonobacteraceae bacterium]